jgi:lipopolysaccharide/colanic/teichoic acid biosynthesis glycosyltransferase
MDCQQITRLGQVLRRWKLDELPQFFNVLRAEMSLVGPRPKIPEHGEPRCGCRPGITGAATLAFAHEELLFASIPKYRLDTFYSHVVLPLKHRLDADYMARATFFSDVMMLFNTALRRWDNSFLLISPNEYERYLQDQQD